MNRLSDNVRLKHLGNTVILSDSGLQSEFIDMRGFDSAMFLAALQGAHDGATCRILLECAVDETGLNEETLKTFPDFLVPEVEGNYNVIVDVHSINLVQNKPFVRITVLETIGLPAEFAVSIAGVAANPHKKSANVPQEADVRFQSWDDE